jgi:hypothetical protein
MFSGPTFLRSFLAGHIYRTTTQYHADCDFTLRDLLLALAFLAASGSVEEKFSLKQTSIRAGL